MNARPTDRQVLGKKGEGIALDFLKKNNYKIIETNFKSLTFGEIDIIAYDQDQLVFIEVKTKSNNQFGLPEEQFNFYKRKKLLKAIDFYFCRKKIEIENWRIDLVAIDFLKTKPNIYHYQAI